MKVISLIKKKKNKLYSEENSNISFILFNIKYLIKTFYSIVTDNIKFLIVSHIVNNLF